MSEKVRPEVRIMLGGEERVMRFDLNAMVTFEELTGRNIKAGIDAETMSAKELRALIFACLESENEGITLRDVGKWFSSENLEEIAASVNAAISKASPEVESGETPPSPLAESREA